MTMPSGYWTFSDTITHHEAEDIARHLSTLDGGTTPMLPEGVVFHPFGPGNTPDALCRYCWSPNLHTSTHCEKCGGPMVH